MLRHLGIGRGDRVVLFLPKSLVFVTIHLALQKLGAVSVPLNPGFKPSEMAYLIQDADPKLVVTGREQEAIIHDAAPDMMTLPLFHVHWLCFALHTALMADALKQ